jgi:hypothetical protein
MADEPMNIYVFNFIENKREWNRRITLIGTTEPVASEALIRSALEDFKRQVKDQKDELETGWYSLDWHRYVVKEPMVPAEHPDAQGYFLDVFVTADGEIRAQNGVTIDV